MGRGRKAATAPTSISTRLDPLDAEELFPKDLFLPVTVVSFLDDAGVHLSESKDSIQNHFVRLPEVAKEFFARL